MKKIFSIALACALCFATACGNEEPDELNRLVPPYQKEDLSDIFFTDEEKSLMINVTDNVRLREILETVDYYEYDKTDLGEAQYTLRIQGLEMEVYGDSVLRFIYEDGIEQTATVLNREFAYLSAVITSGEVAFNGYTGEETVEVKNASNAKAESVDKISLLEDLGELSFVKLGNEDDYEVGDINYKLTVGADEIIVYGAYAKKNGELYYLYQGDFGFLSGLKFGSSSGGSQFLKT